MKPLAFSMRPNHYDQIVGQDHLVGKNGVLRKMINNNHIFSFILYGEPGCGKTTIAEATCAMSNIPNHRFNASTDNKDALKQIVNDARFNEQTIIVIDEIHRMKKDIQDFLLPYVENGRLIMIGLTTVNPYHAVNPAIRSRCHIYKLNDLSHKDLEIILNRACDHLNIKIKDEKVKEYIINISGLEIRSLINNIETLWKNSELDIKQRLQKLIFPKGLTYDLEKFRTPEKSCLFTIIGALSAPSYKMVPPREFESLSTP